MYNFITSCVSAEGFDIEEMQSLSIDVEVGEFLKLAKKEKFKDCFLEELGYDEWSKSDGRSSDELFEKDWSISCCKSFYKGCPSYYVVHSAIEYVYVSADVDPNAIDSEERNDLLIELAEEFSDTPHG